ncbi:MAG: hypothetical protein ACLFVT_00460 [Syntrophobacteria bacterium]
MRAIRRLLKNHPGLLPCSPDSTARRQRRKRYEHIIEDDYDKLEDVAREYRGWVRKMPGWRLEAGEKVFLFGERIAEEYALNMQEVRRLFGEVLPKWMRGALIGFFISGAYHAIIGEGDLLVLDLSLYPGTLSGLGYRHPRGALTILGDRAYYLGVNMRGGEILFRGHPGNHVGTSMQGGKITIEGNARNWIGHDMCGGLIRVKGNVGHIIGKRMLGGEIIIEGDVGWWVADGMKKGVIRIYGACGSSEDKEGGQIFLWRGGEWKEVAPGERHYC